MASTSVHRTTRHLTVDDRYAAILADELGVKITTARTAFIGEPQRQASEISGWALDNGADADLEDLDTDALVGGRFMARVAVSQNGKRNRIDFGSIGRIPAEDADEEFSDIPF